MRARDLATPLGLLNGVLLYLVCQCLLMRQGWTGDDYRAKMDVKSIEKAVVSYWVKDGIYPPNLEVLTRGQAEDGPLLDPAALVDPWGNPYRYRPDVLHPGTKYPLIYSDGPPLWEPPLQIRNWTEQSGGEGEQGPAPRRLFWADPVNAWTLIVLAVFAAPLIFLTVVWFADAVRRTFGKSPPDGTWTCTLAQMAPRMLVFAMVGAVAVGLLFATCVQVYL